MMRTTQALSSVTSTRSASRRTVLIVDDDAMIRGVLERIVRSEGHDLIEATDGRQAVDLLMAGAQVDLMLLDIAMPRLDGLSALAEIREDEGRNLPTVVISGRKGQDDVLRGYRAGVDYYITKPFKSSTVRNILRYLLQDLDDTSRTDLEMLL